MVFDLMTTATGFPEMSDQPKPGFGHDGGQENRRKHRAPQFPLERSTVGNGLEIAIDEARKIGNPSGLVDRLRLDDDGNRASNND